MKPRIIFLGLILIFLAVIFYNLAINAEVAKKLTLEEKLDTILVKQDQILNKLDEIREQLVKIKIRVTRAL